MALENLENPEPQEPPAAPSVPATRKSGRGRDVGTLPGFGKLKAPPHLGFDTHRRAGLPIPARNHLHSSQDIAWLSLWIKAHWEIQEQTGNLVI